MAKLVFGLMQSLDGYVDGELPPPGPALFRHFYEWVRDQTGGVYGRRMYEVMRYWDEDRPEWTKREQDFAAAWRKQPKWVVSRSLKSVGPNATLVADDIEAVIRGLRARLPGEIEVAGPDLARSLTDLSMSIGCTSVPTSSVGESRSSPARDRRFGLWPAIESGRTRSG
jgi:dihydrofolate reductase